MQRLRHLYRVHLSLADPDRDTGASSGGGEPAAAGDGSVQRRQQSPLRPAGERGGLRTLPMAFAAQAVLFALLPLLLGNRWAGLAGVFAMGLLMYLLNTPAQMHALSLAEQDYPSLPACAPPYSRYPTTSALLSAPSSAAPCRRVGIPPPEPAGGNVRPGGTGAEPAASARQRPPDGRGGILRTIKTGSGRISPGLF